MRGVPHHIGTLKKNQSSSKKMYKANIEIFIQKILGISCIMYNVLKLEDNPISYGTFRKYSMHEMLYCR